jgi:predicted nucleic acid-binding protein
MVYLDTNILIYACVEQDITKKIKSISIIEKLAVERQIYLSPLVLQEFIWTMTKLKVDNEIIKKDYEYFKNFVVDGYSYDILQQAINLCLHLDFCHNINDIIHLKIAEQDCQKLLTFDTDFKKLKKHSKLEIEVLV